MRNSKHSARSRGRSTDRFSDGFVGQEDSDIHNRRNGQRNNVKQSRKPNGDKLANKRTANHLTKRNSIDGKGTNGRFIKIWIETLIGTAYEVGIMPDEPIFNLKLKLEIEENIPVVSGKAYRSEKIHILIRNLSEFTKLLHRTDRLISAISSSTKRFTMARTN